MSLWSWTPLRKVGRTAFETSDANVECVVVREKEELEQQKKQRRLRPHSTLVGANERKEDYEDTAFGGPLSKLTGLL